MKTKLTINAHHMTKPSLVDLGIDIRSRFQAVLRRAETALTRSVPPFEEGPGNFFVLSSFLPLRV
jgi:hypothetical protein